MKLRDIRKFLGLPVKASSRMDAPEANTLLAAIKERIIAARRANDDALAAQWSEAKAVVKKAIRPRCVDCGNPITMGNRCRMHATLHLFYGRSLPKRN